jgi:NAD(P)-dependent dehydrogenase (short-subunit alcohol dehydrogenase family)
VRHAVVTGSSSGIGAAVARRLLDAGDRVTGLDRAPPAFTHEAFAGVALDLADREATRASARALDPADILVHAAGVMRAHALPALDVADGDLLWRLHAGAAETLAGALAPRMREGGRIVLIGSISARGVPGRSQYAASKAALVALAKSWAAELLARGITVNVVAPATTDTAMLADPARAGTAPKLPPIGRLIRPDEVAALVGFLCSPEAAAITGQEITICGGASLRLA